MNRQMEAYIVLSGRTKKELAQELGISYNTMLSKLNGNSSFTLDEAVQLKELLDTREPVEELFEQRAKQTV